MQRLDAKKTHLQSGALMPMPGTTWDIFCLGLFDGLKKVQLKRLESDIFGSVDVRNVQKIVG